MSLFTHVGALHGKQQEASPKDPQRRILADRQGELPVVSNPPMLMNWSKGPYDTRASQYLF